MNRRDFLGVMGAGLAGVGAAPWRTLRAGGDVFVERWSWAMGQPVHLQLFAASEAAGYEVAQAALAELRRVEAALSRFDEASDLSELNRCAGRDAIAVGADLAAALGAAAPSPWSTTRRRSRPASAPMRAPRCAGSRRRCSRGWPGWSPPRR